MMNRLYLMASAFLFFACKPVETLSKTTDSGIEYESATTGSAAIRIPSASEKIYARDF
jgi:hypothetical protein